MKRLEFPSDGKRFGYLLYLPNDYDAAKTYPLMVFMHGAGERGNGKDELSRVENTALPMYLRQGRYELPCIVFAPQCDESQIWNQRVYDVLALLDRIMETYPVDRRRVTVTGISMGGYATWEMGMTRPGMFAALAPICGGGTAWRAHELTGKKIWTVHGNADSIVNISCSQDMVRCARAAGAEVTFTILDGVDHDSWSFAYTQLRLIEWLLEQTL